MLLELLEKLIAELLEKALDKNNAVIVDGIASALSTNLAALSADLSAPTPPTLAPLFEHPEQYWMLNASNVLVRLLDYQLNGVMGVSGPLNFNFLLQRFNLTSLSLGTLLANRTVELVESIAGIGAIDVSVYGATLKGLDTFNVVQLLLPVADNVVESRLGLGELALSNVSIGFTFRFNSSNLDDPAILDEAITLDLNLTDVELNMTNLILIDANLHLQGQQYVDPGCLERAVQNVTVASSGASSQMSGFVLQSPGGAEPLDAQVGELLNDMMQSLDGAFPLFVPQLVANAARVPLAAAIEGLMESFHAAGKVNGTTFASCGLYTERTDAFWAHFPLPYLGTILSLCFFAFFSVAAIVALVWHSRRRRDSLDHQSSSLLLTARYHVARRAVVPVIMFFCLACFVVVMVGTTGFSTIQLTLDGKEIPLPSMFLFNLPNLLTDAYDARAWANVIGLAVFGIFWMFARQVLLLLLYVAPAFKWREQCVFAVDILGKWCGFFFIEAMLIPVAFRVHVQPIPGVAIDMYTAGSAAYFLYILAFFLSLAAGNVAYAMVTNLRRPVLMESFSDSHKTPLFRRSFVADHVRVHMKGGAVAFMSLLLLLTLGLSVASMFVESFAFEMEGLMGTLLPLAGAEKTRSYSIASMVAKYDTIVPAVFWMYVSQVALALACIALPLLCCLSFFVLFFVPLSDRMHATMLRTVEVLRCWNCLEVFWGALLAAMLSISLLGQFLVGDNCILINRLLAQYFADLLAGDPVCYDVQTIPLAGFWLMLAACVCSFITGQLLVGLAAAALRGGRRGKVETSSDGEFLIDVPRKKKTSWWLARMTEEVESRAFRTDLIQ